MTDGSSFRPLKIRKTLMQQTGRYWTVPTPFGPDGWHYIAKTQTVVITCGDIDPDSDDEWIHASIAGPDEDPTYNDLKALHAAVFGDGYAYQVFVPPAEHVNIHAHALHLWGRLDGKPVLPLFGLGGTI